MPERRPTFYRIPQHPPGQTRKDAVKIGELRPGEDPANTLDVLWRYERSLMHGERGTDPRDFIFIDPPLPVREIPFPPSKQAA